MEEIRNRLLKAAFSLVEAKKTREKVPTSRGIYASEEANEAMWAVSHAKDALERAMEDYYEAVKKAETAKVTVILNGCQREVNRNLRYEDVLELCKLPRDSKTAIITIHSEGIREGVMHVGDTLTLGDGCILNCVGS